MALLRREDVDLVVLNQASLLLRQRVLRDGRLLFANNDRERVRFAAETYRRYLDCRYMYDVLDEAMFARLQEGRFGRGQVGARARFDKLERCIAKVRAALEDFDEDAYLQDTFLQDVVERNLQLATQIVLDVSTYVIAQQRSGAPGQL